MYHNVLVPLDGSTFGEAALPLALNIARRAGARLQLVNVLPPLGPIYTEAVLFTDTNLELELRQHNLTMQQAYLDEVVQRLKEAAKDIHVSTRVLEGDIAAALRAHATDSGADLVVMTTHARGPLGRFWLGSVADELVRRLPMPVLLVRPCEGPPVFEPEPLLKHILIPLDGEPFAEQILEPALELGRLLGADFTLLRVIKPVFPITYPVDNASMAQVAQAVIERTQEMQEQVRLGAQDYLERLAMPLRAKGLCMLTRVEVEDKPALAILHQAGAIDLIALETHGRRGLSRVLLGSVADKVIRGSNLPVLVHRPVEVKTGGPKEVSAKAKQAVGVS
jgi:nucleotide-binding universal stress UspA family protein